MFSFQLEQLLTQISATSVTELFIYAIGIIFVFAIIFSLIGRFQRFTQYAPTLMTSLGILGTFVGIVIGLLGFDTSNIDGSIPELLEGLKTAFITSICGLIGAISFNFVDSLFLQAIGARKKQILVEEEITPLHIYQALQLQNQTMAQMDKGIETLHQGLTGQEEGSLIGQFKLLRTDLITMARHSEMLPKQLESLIAIIQSTSETATEERKLLTEEVSLLRTECSAIRQQNVLLTDFMAQFTQFTQVLAEQHETFSTNLFQKLEDFAEMLSKSATEQIIEALKNVIEEFNHNLMDQFGENFKALDHSVGQLVTWQAQYKEQVEVMGEQYAQSVASLVETKESVSGIWQACENIPVAMDQLKDVLTVNQHQIAELQRHLESFVAMRDAAIEAVPQIQAQLDQVGSDLTAASESMKTQLLQTSEQLLTGSNEMRLALEEGAEHFKDSVSTTQQHLGTLSQTVQSTSIDLSATLKESSESLTEQAQIVLSEMKEGVSTIQAEVGHSLTELHTQLSGIQVEIADQAKEMVAHFSEGVHAIQQEIERSSTSISTQTSEMIDQLTKNLADTYQEFEDSCETLVSQSEMKAEALANSFNQQLVQSQDTYKEMLTDSMKLTGDVINNKLERLEQATAREIQTAMQEMGDSLVKITTRFVNDYEKMVHAMDKVIQSHPSF